MEATQIFLKPCPPFSFDLSAQIFAGGDRQIRFYENGKFTQVIRLGSTLVLATVSAQGTVEEPALMAELKSTKPLAETDRREARKIITKLFNLDLDLSPFQDSVKQDPTMLALARKLRGLRSPTTQTVYEALVDSIISQQISLQLANAMIRRLIKQFGETLQQNGTLYYEYPTPQRLAEATLEEMRGCSLSGRKAEYIKDISALISNHTLDLEKIKNYQNTDRIVQELDAIRGVGLWTAELTVIRSMQKWDAFPADDVGLRQIMAHYYCHDERISSTQARQIAEPWGNWRGLAAFYLVIAAMLEVEVT